jgi:hypothetical protein
MKRAAIALAGCLLAIAPAAHAHGAAALMPVDRAIVRFEAHELGGSARPRFIFERTLAFEARLEALAEARRGVPLVEGVRFEDRHVRAALERHVTEEILASLPVDPPLTDAEVRARAVPTMLMLQDLVGGRPVLLDAAVKEGMETEDLDELVRRRARASLYLDRMVAPMLEPSDAELREVHRTEATPFRDLPFEQVQHQLRQWYVSDRLGAALAAFFRSARARIDIVVLAPLAPAVSAASASR